MYNNRKIKIIEPDSPVFVYMILGIFVLFLILASFSLELRYIEYRTGFRIAAEKAKKESLLERQRKIRRMTIAANAFIRSNGIWLAYFIDRLGVTEVPAQRIAAEKSAGGESGS